MAEIYKTRAGREAIEAMYRRALECWPVPHEEIVVPTRQGATFVIASGDRNAPPVVLFHGSGTNSAMWIRDVVDWARDYRVYAVDMIGEPGFSAASRPPLASAAYAEWLDDVWDGLKLERASLVGVSLGGWLALDYAVRRPYRVASLSMVSPSGIGRQNHGALLRLALLRLCGTWGLRRSMRVVAGKAAPLSDQTSAYLATVFRSFRPRMERIPIRSDQELAALTMPAQLIVGADDVLLRSIETRDRLRRAVPHAQIAFLENTGHVVPPQTRAIREFISAHAVEKV